MKGEKTADTKTAQVAPQVCKGPMEGILIVNGRPQVEAADMPVFSFENIEAILRLQKNETPGA